MSVYAVFVATTCQLAEWRVIIACCCVMRAFSDTREASECVHYTQMSFCVHGMQGQMVTQQQQTCHA